MIAPGLVEWLARSRQSRMFDIVVFNDLVSDGLESGATAMPASLGDAILASWLAKSSFAWVDHESPWRRSPLPCLCAPSIAPSAELVART